MSTSFLDLPLELRQEIYKLIIPVEREPNGELSTVGTDPAYWEDYPIDDGSESSWRNTPLPTMSNQVLSLGARVMATCRQVNEELTPYVYSQPQFLFYRSQQALEWLDRIGHFKTYLHNVAIVGTYLPHEAVDSGRQVQADMWASFLRKVPNITNLSCLDPLHVMHWALFDRSDTVWNDEGVLKAIRSLAHLRVLFIDAALRVDGWHIRDSQSSLELAFDQPLLETLVLSGHPVAGIEWYHEDYFDRLVSLRHLTIREGLRMQSGKSKVSRDFFSHVAPLRSFTWHGNYLTASHQKSFTQRHGGTLQFLDLGISWKLYPLKMAARRLEELRCLESLTNMFGALPVQLRTGPWGTL